MPTPPLSADLAFRGLIHQVSDPDLPGRLDAEPITAYIGFDPSADSLQLGNLQMLTNLRRMQLAGHRPIVLAGGGTGLIGDPGGKESERPLLDAERHAANMVAIKAQLEQFLDFSPGPAAALALDNADWLCGLGVVEFLRDVGKHFTVNHMIAKESVASRIARPDRGISFTEFSYMLLQAYDFLYLFDHHGCRLQMGGSDQWGNIVEGIELVRRVRGAEAFALTSPLVLNADGTKMGKTEDGTIWLDAAKTSPYELYQLLVRTPDDVVGGHLRRLTFLDHETILDLDAQTRERPERRAAQRALAREVTALVHGPEQAERALRAAELLFSEGVVDLDEESLLGVLADAPSSERARVDLDGDGLDLVEALVEAGMAQSKSAARTTAAQGGAYVNNHRRDAGEPITRGDLLHDRYVLLRKGKRDQHLLIFR